MKRLPSALLLALLLLHLAFLFLVAAISARVVILLKHLLSLFISESFHNIKPGRHEPANRVKFSDFFQRRSLGAASEAAEVLNRSVANLVPVLSSVFLHVLAGKVELLRFRANAGRNAKIYDLFVITRSWIGSDILVNQISQNLEHIVCFHR